MIIKTLVLWVLATLTLAAGVIYLRDTSMRKKWAGLILFTMALSYPVVHTIGVLPLLLVKSTFTDFGMPEAKLQTMRNYLASDTISPKARYNFSKVIANDEFWKTGRLVDYVDTLGRTVRYEPDDTDAEIAMSVLKIQTMLRTGLPSVFIWLSSIPIGILLGIRFKPLGADPKPG